MLERADRRAGIVAQYAGPWRYHASKDHLKQMQIACPAGMPQSHPDSPLYKACNGRWATEDLMQK